MDTTSIMILVVLAGLLILTFVLPMLTNKKNQAKALELKESIKAGDKVMTIGAIIGTVVEVNDNANGSREIVISTGKEGSETTMTIDILGIYKNFTAIEAHAEALANAQNVDSNPDVFEEETKEEVKEEVKEEETVEETVEEAKEEVKEEKKPAKKTTKK